MAREGRRLAPDPKGAELHARGYRKFRALLDWQPPS
jgi:hypothetical protein